MINNNRKWILGIIESSLIVGCYFLIYWIKKHSIVFPEFPYDRFLYVYFVSWWLTSLFYKTHIQNESRMTGIFLRGHLIHSTSILFLLSLVCILTIFSQISRLFLFQIVLIPSIIEVIIRAFIYRKSNNNDAIESLPTDEKVTENLSTMRIIGSGLILAICYTAYFKYRSISFGSYDDHEPTIILLSSSWILSSFITGKFNPQSGKNLYYKISPFIKSFIFMVSIAGFLYFFLRLDVHISKHELFATIYLFGLTETILSTLIFMGRKSSIEPPISLYQPHYSQKELIEETTSLEDDRSLLGQLNLISYKSIDEIRYEIQHFFGDNIEIIHPFKIIYDRSTFTTDLFQRSSLKSLMNFCTINDLYDMNSYFSAAHLSLKNKGYLIGVYSPQDILRATLEKQMPRYLFFGYYPFFYFTHRVLPKISLFGKLYALASRGRNRVLSRAELWGRLAYAGFKVKHEREINGTILFIAQKYFSPAKEEYPSYGLLIRLKRIGLHGQMIRIYKLRTMYPYSEFIQQEVFKLNALDANGKINDDFRRNSAGKYLRKLWLDELPQLVNWVKGDVTLVGVRALSEQYYNLYPEDLQKLRNQFKPGLVPPYYADMPKSFEDIIESERRYLMRKKLAPFKTDFTYFFKAFSNIILKGARSA
jgi:hypothetical protein